jgi:hypothetical protein
MDPANVSYNFACQISLSQWPLCRKLSETASGRDPNQVDSAPSQGIIGTDGKDLHRILQELSWHPFDDQQAIFRERSA